MNSLPATARFYQSLLISAFLYTGFTAQDSVVAQQQPSSGATFRVISYNILEGFTNKRSDRFPAGEERKKKVGDWLNALQPDVIAFQELNGYTADRLRRDAAAWGHQHAETVKDDGYIVGITSKKPITVIERHLKGMHHGLLHVRIDAIHFLVLHLSPFKYQHRQQEMGMVLERVNRIRDEGNEVIVLGDFNALSPMDREHHTSPRALERARQQEERHAHVRNLNQGRFDYTVIGAILASGLTDTDAKHPDTYDKDGSSRRIDYIFASPGLARRSIASYRTVTQEFTRMSDHYPVVAEFQP